MKEEGEKVEKAGKNLEDDEILHFIALWREMELDLPKIQRNKVNSNLLKPYNFIFLDLNFCLFS
jgi:hypothetical protein